MSEEIKPGHSHMSKEAYEKEVIRVDLSKASVELAAAAHGIRCFGELYAQHLHNTAKEIRWGWSGMK